LLRERAEADADPTAAHVPDRAVLANIGNNIAVRTPRVEDDTRPFRRWSGDFIE
jgi:hypothetical protein